VFGPSAMSLGPRNRFFGLSGRWTKTGLSAMNKQLVCLQRVVLHPAYRGAGLAAQFVKRCCEALEWPWIESLAEMGRINPFLEKAGFVRVGECRKRNESGAATQIQIYGAVGGATLKKVGLTAETIAKSRFANPAYYVFDNRKRAKERVNDA